MQVSFFLFEVVVGWGVRFTDESGKRIVGEFKVHLFLFIPMAKSPIHLYWVKVLKIV